MPLTENGMVPGRPIRGKSNESTTSSMNQDEQQLTSLSESGQVCTVVHVLRNTFSKIIFVFMK